MPEAKSLQWPVNLIEDKTYRNKSIYVSDYCTRTKRIPERRRAKTKETPARYAKDIFNPSSRFLNDHFQTSSHLDLKHHCEKILNSIDKNSTKNGNYSYHEKARSNPVYSGLPPTPVIEDESEPLVNFLPPSLRRIEAAWQDEANATKRERGYLYGKAGTKKWYNPKQDSRAKNVHQKASLPGMTRWLDEANEYEKQVVYNFMNNVSDALKDEPLSSEFADFTQNEEQHYSDNPKIEDYMNNLAAEDDGITRPQTPLDIQQYDDEYFMLEDPFTQNPLPENDNKYKNVSFKQPEIDDVISVRPPSSLTSRDLANDDEVGYKGFQKEAGNLAVTIQRQQHRPNSSQAYYGNSGRDHQYSPIPRAKSAQGRYVSDVAKTNREKVQSPRIYQAAGDYNRGSIRTQSAKAYREIEASQPRARSADFTRKSGQMHSHKHHHNHKGSNCVTCQEREIKQMAAQLEAMKPISYLDRKYQRNVAANQMYKMSLNDYAVAEDYMASGSVFKKVSNRGPGHFIIHPEWISERIAPKKSFR